MGISREAFGEILEGIPRDKLWIETQRGTVEGSPGKISIRNSRKTADGIQEKCMKDNLGRTVC